MPNNQPDSFELFVRKLTKVDDKADKNEVAQAIAQVIRSVRDNFKQHTTRVDQLDSRVSQVAKMQGPQGKPGKQGPKGDRGAPGRDGRDGRDGMDGLSGSPDEPQAIRDKLERLQGEQRLHISAIHGADELLKGAGEPRRTMFGVPSRGLFLYIAGVKKGIISNLNVVGAGGATVAYSKVNGQDTLTITASGGGITVSTPTGTVDGTTTQFTPTGQPKWVVADGTTYYENNGYTWDGTHINMANAPSEYIRDII